MTINASFIDRKVETLIFDTSELQSDLMESPTPVSRYIPQNSKKRVFMAESSSSGCKEVELLVSSPNNRTSKPKSSKQKEVICHEIIDVDMDEDSDEVMFTDVEVHTSAKGKEVLSISSGDLSSLAYDESGSGILSSKNGAVGLHDLENVDDFDSNLYYGEDEWIDTDYEDIVYDDFATLESHFDHMDIPPGVEMSFPWLPSSAKDDRNVTSAGTSTNASMKIQANNINPSPGLNSSNPSWSNSLTDVGMDAGNQHFNGKLPSIRAEPGLVKKKMGISGSIADLSSRSSKSSLFPKANKASLHLSGKSSNRKSRASTAFFSSHYGQLPSVPLHPSTVNGSGSYPIPNVPPKGLGVKSFMPGWQDLPMNVFEPSLSPSGFMNDKPFIGSVQDHAGNLIGTSPVETTKVVQRNLDEVLLNFYDFKKFDIVEDSSDHHYSKNGSSTKQISSKAQSRRPTKKLVNPPKNWAKRIQEEWKILEKDLPGLVYESRMDLLRAVIIGAEGTPYHGGLFFFDVFFPSTYPNVPPHVHYRSRGLRINPNLYNCGKVCLSLLNTWSGSVKEKWVAGVSTMLQVLVSIQGLILNAKPYFNEPGYANMRGTVLGEKNSLEYNERTFIYNLQTMVYNMRRPPMYYEDFAFGYFCKHARGILVSCKAYLDGAQVGCLAKGGVQDVDEGDKSCSQEFKSSLSLFMRTLVNQFIQIGAKDCEEFLYLAELEKQANGST
ncbi:Ubiquitin-conjugating enzyme E2, catalytic domain ues [Orobanche gracilis]